MLGFLLVKLDAVVTLVANILNCYIYKIFTAYTIIVNQVYIFIRNSYTIFFVIISIYLKKK